jgi:Restriction endonuclease
MQQQASHSASPLLSQNPDPSGPDSLLFGLAARMQDSAPKINDPDKSHMVAFVGRKCEPAAGLPHGDALLETTIPYRGKTAVDSYRGPAWIGQDGLPCIVIISTQPNWIPALKDMETVPMVTLCWDSTPSSYISLTVMGSSKNPKPLPRWLRPRRDPVLQALKEKLEFWFTVAHPGGKHTGWMKAVIGPNGHDFLGMQYEGKEEFLDYFARSGTGIYMTQKGTRCKDFKDDDSTDDFDQIPLWADSAVDFWQTICWDGPWMFESVHSDWLRYSWAKKAYETRQQLALDIQFYKDDLEFDGAQPFFDEFGAVTSKMPEDNGRKFTEFLLKNPLIIPFLVAIAGPTPDTLKAKEEMLLCLKNPGAARSLAIFIEQIVHLDPHLFAYTVNSLFLGITDSSITKEGLLRPWFEKSPDGLILRTTPMDLSAPMQGVEAFWRQGLDIGSLLGTGLRVSGSEFPMLSNVVDKAMNSVSLEGSSQEVLMRAKSFLEEISQARQWSIPWGARVEIQIGPFVAMRVFESNGEFRCHFLDAKDQYFQVFIHFDDGESFIACSRIYTFEENDDPHEVEYNEEAEAILQLIAASVVRDFVVFEERSSLFSERPFKRRIGGRDVRSVIYLPRVNYTKMVAHDSNSQHQDASGDSRHRSRHGVAHHIRRVGQASVAQRFHAQRYGIHVPEGFTFVRPHERGGQSTTERIKIYRSRSASRMLFQELSKAPAGNRPKWFEFEKDCARVLRERGLDVIHQAVNRDGDGGVDLFATDSSEQTYVVQCKCYSANRPVGPEVVRELVGAIALADQGAKGTSRGILMTTSTFTSGAVTAALTLGFEIIDGAKMASLLK